MLLLHPNNDGWSLRAQTYEKDVTKALRASNAPAGNLSSEGAPLDFGGSLIAQNII